MTEGKPAEAAALRRVGAAKTAVLRRPRPGHHRSDGRGWCPTRRCQAGSLCRSTSKPRCGGPWPRTRTLSRCVRIWPCRPRHCSWHGAGRRASTPACRWISYPGLSSRCLAGESPGSSHCSPSRGASPSNWGTGRRSGSRSPAPSTTRPGGTSCRPSCWPWYRRTACTRPRPTGGRSSRWPSVWRPSTAVWPTCYGGAWRPTRRRRPTWSWRTSRARGPPRRQLPPSRSTSPR